MRYRVERTVRSGSGTVTVNVAGPVRQSRAEETLRLTAEQEYLHHKAKGGPDVDVSWGAWGEDTAFMVCSEMGVQVYTYRLVEVK
jgi:hypothetical protein